MGRVSIRACENYEVNRIKEVLKQSVADLGGFSPYIEPGSRVLLKVNLLMKKKPEEATTTHPAFVKALAELLIEHGCSVLIGDSPGGPFNKNALIPIYSACGYQEMDNGENISLNWNFSDFEKPFHQGKLLKKANVVGMLQDVDHVVSVSKLKTHGMMLFTGAVKNMFGVIPGLTKAEYHFKMPKNEDFADALVDICEGLKPVLSFMDGIVGMEGAGPSAGEPIEIGLILAAENPHELDHTAVQIVGISPMEVPTLRSAINRNLISESGEGVSICGVSMEEAKKRVEKFETPEIRSVAFLDEKFPKWLRGAADKMLKPKPVFMADKCIGCGECARLCPPQVITMVDRFPQVELSKCIRCYCCQELCPKKAVEIYRPWLLKVMTKM